MPVTPFVGQVAIHAINFAPRGWAQCNGQLLPVSQNTALFSILGTTYGGDGRTTFGLPNLQGRAALHPGRGPGLTSRRLGERGGAETVTLGAAQIPTHSHTVEAFAGAAPATDSNPQGNALARPLIDIYGDAEDLVDFATEAVSEGSAGGSQPHDNMPPFLVLNYCIALIGIYPSRS